MNPSSIQWILSSRQLKRRQLIVKSNKHRGIGVCAAGKLFLDDFPIGTLYCEAIVSFAGNPRMVW
jgi:hypothetical protein